MTKSTEADVLFVFNKATDGLWLALIDALEEPPKVRHEEGGYVYGLLAINRYSLEDPYFFQFWVTLSKGEDLLLTIPRQNVRGIVKGTPEARDLCFARLKPS